MTAAWGGGGRRPSLRSAGGAVAGAWGGGGGGRVEGSFYTQTTFLQHVILYTPMSFPHGVSMKRHTAKQPAKQQGFHDGSEPGALRGTERASSPSDRPGQERRGARWTGWAEGTTCRGRRNEGGPAAWGEEAGEAPRPLRAACRTSHAEGGSRADTLGTREPPESKRQAFMLFPEKETTQWAANAEMSNIEKKKTSMFSSVYEHRIFLNLCILSII